MWVPICMVHIKSVAYQKNTLPEKHITYLRSHRSYLRIGAFLTVMPFGWLNGRLHMSAYKQAYSFLVCCSVVPILFYSVFCGFFIEHVVGYSMQQLCNSVQQISKLFLLTTVILHSLLTSRRHLDLLNRLDDLATVCNDLQPPVDPKMKRKTSRHARLQSKTLVQCVVLTILISLDVDDVSRALGTDILLYLMIFALNVKVLHISNVNAVLTFIGRDIRLRIDRIFNDGATIDLETLTGCATALDELAELIGGFDRLFGIFVLLQLALDFVLLLSYTYIVLFYIVYLASWRVGSFVLFAVSVLIVPDLYRMYWMVRACEKTTEEVRGGWLKCDVNM